MNIKNNPLYFFEIKEPTTEQIIEYVNSFGSSFGLSTLILNQLFENSECFSIPMKLLKNIFFNNYKKIDLTVKTVPNILTILYCNENNSDYVINDNSNSVQKYFLKHPQYKSFLENLDNLKKNNIQEYRAFSTANIYTLKFNSYTENYLFELLDKLPIDEHGYVTNKNYYDSNVYKFLNTKIRHLSVYNKTKLSTLETKYCMYLLNNNSDYKFTKQKSIQQIIKNIQHSIDDAIKVKDTVDNKTFIDYYIINVTNKIMNLYSTTGKNSLEQTLSKYKTQEDILEIIFIALVLNNNYEQQLNNEVITRNKIIEQTYNLLNNQSHNIISIIEKYYTKNEDKEQFFSNLYFTCQHNDDLLLKIKTDNQLQSEIYSLSKKIVDTNITLPLLNLLNENYVEKFFHTENNYMQKKISAYLLRNLESLKQINHFLLSKIPGEHISLDLIAKDDSHYNNEFNDIKVKDRVEYILLNKVSPIDIVKHIYQNKNSKLFLHFSDTITKTLDVENDIHYYTLLNFLQPKYLDDFFNNKQFDDFKYIQEKLNARKTPISDSLVMLIDNAWNEDADKKSYIKLFHNLVLQLEITSNDIQLGKNRKIKL